MFVGMGYAMWTTDELERELIADEAQRSRLTAKDVAILEELDFRQVATADGCRSLSEWATARLDVHPDRAKSLVRTMRRTVDRPDLRAALASGEISFDRMEALSRIPEDVGFLEQMDVAGVCHQAANRARISAETEYRTANDQFLVMQPSLDESWWRLWGGLDGATGALVDKTLTQAADELPLLPDGTRGDSPWRKAIALAELCITDDPPAAQLTVFVDTNHATTSNGQAGVVLEAGPRIGREALEPSSAMRSSKSPPEPKTAPQWSTDGKQEPSRPPNDGPSSTATAMCAPPTAGTAETGFKSTTSSPGQKAERPTPTI
jgi:hypothetical protein